jgi:hypothetical protein
MAGPPDALRDSVGGVKRTSPSTGATAVLPGQAQKEPLPAPAALPLSDVAAAPAPADPRPVEVEARLITVVVESEPDGARVYRDGVELGVTPYQYTAPWRADSSTLTLRRSGYRAMSVSFPGDRSDTVNVVLVARKSEPRSKLKPKLKLKPKSAAVAKQGSGDPSEPAQPVSPTLDEELLSR